MFTKATIHVLFASTVLACSVGAVEVEVVPVGNPGNAPDAETGFGSVDYPYMMGEYEVTAGQYCEFLNAVARTDTYALYNVNMWSHDRGCKIERTGSPGDYSYSVAADRVNRPVNYVSWADAVRFCNWLHNGQPTTGMQDLTTTENGTYFLDGASVDTALMAITREDDASWFIPTENEWYKAAYHKNADVTGDYWLYATSSSLAPTNTVVDPDPGNHANFYDWYRTGNGSYTIGSRYYTTEVGAFENSESPYGTFDQSGNLWEWNETARTDSSRGLRGGCWSNSPDFLRATYRNSSSPINEAPTIGFRVAHIPEPGGIILLTCGLAAGLSRRRRATDSS